jgi:hypothetical protein
MNVYDAASISAVVHLSVQSVAKKSAAVDFPDFTRGRWKTTPPIAIVHDSHSARLRELRNNKRTAVQCRGIRKRLRCESVFVKT